MCQCSASFWGVVKLRVSISVFWRKARARGQGQGVRSAAVRSAQCAVRSAQSARRPANALPTRCQRQRQRQRPTTHDASKRRIPYEHLPVDLKLLNCLNAEWHAAIRARLGSGIAFPSSSFFLDLRRSRSEFKIDLSGK
jgi:hypothetical protein